MIDRIEEYRRDWVAGPTPKLRRRKFRLRRQWKVGVLLVGGLLLAAASGFLAVKEWRRRVERRLNDEVNAVKTDLEISSMVRLLRQYYLSNAALPPSPENYLKPFLKSNKPYPVGNDFWGRPYKVEHDFEGFAVRSAGPDGIYGNRDDRSQGLKYRQFTSQD